MGDVLTLTPEQRAVFFRYDRSLPLNLEERPAEHDDGVEVIRFRFDSTHHQRVPGIIWRAANSSGRAPVILLQHGASSHKEDVYIRLPALRWARQGFTCVSIDANGHGERQAPAEEPGRFWQYPWLRKEHAVQMAVDLMRTVDYLETRPDVDLGRIGYLGFSMGTIMGVPFVGLDGRVKSACFAIGGSMIGRLGIQDPQVPGDKYDAVVEIIDPVHFAPLIAPRPVLMINGRQDETIPPAAGERLFDALGEPKRIVWYDGGHTDLRGAQFREMLSFFQETLK